MIDMQKPFSPEAMQNLNNWHCRHAECTRTFFPAIRPMERCTDWCRCPCDGCVQATAGKKLTKEEISRLVH